MAEAAAGEAATSNPFAPPASAGKKNPFAQQEKEPFASPDAIKQVRSETGATLREARGALVGSDGSSARAIDSIRQQRGSSGSGSGSAGGGIELPETSGRGDLTASSPAIVP